LYVVRRIGRGQRLAPKIDNLLAGAVSRHSLDRLNTSTDFQKKKKGVLVSLSNLYYPVGSGDRFA